MAQPLGRDPSRPFASLAAYEDPGLLHPGRSAAASRRRRCASSASRRVRRWHLQTGSFKARIGTTREGAKLKAGAQLAREWNGKLERVMVLDKGFAWNGETYGSLSQVARAMTGTSWNGHRFFGLRTARSDRSAMVRRRSAGCDATSPDALSTAVKDSRGVYASGFGREAASP
jgi:hypothetical protein